MNASPAPTLRFFHAAAVPIMTPAPPRGPPMTAVLLAALVLPPAAPRDLAPPIEKDGWLRPAPGKRSEPVWGVPGGIAVGLWPARGPRGLLRIYAPYLGQKHP